MCSQKLFCHGVNGVKNETGYLAIEYGLSLNVNFNKNVLMAHGLSFFEARYWSTQPALKKILSKRIRNSSILDFALAMQSVKLTKL